MNKKIIAKSGGQLQPERPGHFHPEKGGQFHPEKAGILIRNIHVNKYVRQYSFISQIITFVDIDLEKFYLFTKLLFKYLPYEKETLPLEVTQMVDMDKFKIQEKENGSIALNPTDSILENPQGDGHKGKNIDPKAVLEIIVKEINDKYAVELGDDDKVVKEMYASLKNDEALLASLRANNIEDVKRMKLRESIDKALLKNAEPPIEFMNRLAKDKGLANYVVSQFYHLIMKDLDNEKLKEYYLPKGGNLVAAEPE